MRYPAAIVTLVASLTCVQPSLGQAQPASPDATLLARADSISVGDYCRVAQQVLAAPGVNGILGADSSDARQSAAAICDPFLSSFSLRALAGRAPAPFRAVARVRTGGAPSSRAAVFEAMSQFAATVRGADVREAISGAIGAELNTQLVRTSVTAQGLLLAGARDASLERLGKYERKLGPTSARLNFPEVLLNYGLQRWVPAFRPTPLGGPSHLELIASYSPAYATLSRDSVQAVSASEFGVRYYMFGKAFGASGWRGVLLPTYWSFGLLTASDRNGALVWPWDGRDHSGPFVSWGSVKVAWVQGRAGSRFLASKQFQAIPFVF